MRGFSLVESLVAVVIASVLFISLTDVCASLLRQSMQYASEIARQTQLVAASDQLAADLSESRNTRCEFDTSLVAIVAEGARPFMVGKGVVIQRADHRVAFADAGPSLVEISTSHELEPGDLLLARDCSGATIRIDAELAYSKVDGWYRYDIPLCSASEWHNCIDREISGLVDFSPLREVLWYRRKNSLYRFEKAQPLNTSGLTSEVLETISGFEVRINADQEAEYLSFTLKKEGRQIELAVPI